MCVSSQSALHPESRWHSETFPFTMLLNGAEIMTCYQHDMACNSRLHTTDQA
jgi:hypothetical protein